MRKSVATGTAHGAGGAIGLDTRGVGAVAGATHACRRILSMPVHVVVTCVWWPRWVRRPLALTIAAAGGALLMSSPLQAADPPVASPKLPRVEKKKPAQPEVGLPADTHLDKTPPRMTKGLDLVKMGWSYDCMECHRSIDVNWRNDRERVEHQTIQLDHGNNRFCLTCHNQRNMATFVDYDGAEIKERDVVSLCAKCHGTVHRDWEAGVHGRQNGFWDRTKGARTRLRCIQCHDPHSPKFKPVKALRGPNYPARAAGKKAGEGKKEK